MSLRTLFLRSICRQKVVTNFVPIVSQKNYYHDYRYRSTRERSKKYIKWYFLAAVGVGSGDSKDDNGGAITPGVARPGLRTYRASEVKKHNTKKSCWVTFKAGVYDVTDFIEGHPGGEQILEAAGGSIEPFWSVYRQHHTEQVYEILEELRIGNLHEDDIVEFKGTDDLWAHEPKRNSHLKVLVERPFNAETPPPLLIKELDTSNELFFVRHHMPVPAIDGARHKVRVSVSDGVRGAAAGRHGDLSVAALAGRKQADVRAALMCAGNRRSEMNQVSKVKGLEWTAGAISNAHWTGPLLRDILMELGVDPDDTDGYHVTFVGEDKDANGEHFSTSIPLSMAMDPNQRVILALKMNGEDLTPDHGYPVRVIVPGAIAFRSVKWLKCIRVDKEESPSHFHKKDYRSFNSSTSWQTADFESAPPIYNAPVTSAICCPAEGSVVEPHDGLITVKGYAYSGGGNKILRVDVSADGGGTWVAAHTMVADPAPPPRHFGWTLWTARVPLPEGTENQDGEREDTVQKKFKQIELVVRATDSNHNTQPETARFIWNIRGLLCNSYHRVRVFLDSPTCH